MAIINATLVQGSELKTAENAAATYIADKVVYSVGTLTITQRQLITGGLCFLAAWALKD